jgi:cytochrome c-type biogenesis protein CcmH/NrfG
MRHPSAALVAAHAALILLACSELMSWDKPEPPASEPPARLLDTARVASPSSGDSVSWSELGELDRQVDSLMLSVRDNERDVEAMVALAHLYMRRGSFDHAVGPLARAAELVPAREDVRYELRLALELSDRAEQQADLAA